MIKSEAKPKRLRRKAITTHERFRRLLNLQIGPDRNTMQRLESVIKYLDCALAVAQSTDEAELCARIQAVYDLAIKSHERVLMERMDAAGVE